MKKKKRFKTGIDFKTGITVLLLAGLTVLTGCRLAGEVNPEDLNSDRLCGVLVTMGTQIDTSIPEGTTFNSMDELVNYDHSKRVAGIAQEDGSYLFEGVHGYFMTFFEEPFDVNGVTEVSTVTYQDPAIQDTKTALIVTDQGEEHKLEGTVMISRFSPDAYYMNPVYRKSDGSIYALMGTANGIFISPGSSPGTVSSQTIKDEYSTKSEGKTSYQSTEIKVNYKVITGIKKAVVKEMSADDELLTSYELKQDEAQYRISGDTAYIIIEETDADQTGTVNRSIYSVPAEDSAAITPHVLYYLGEEEQINVVTLEFKR